MLSCKAYPIRKDPLVFTYGATPRQLRQIEAERLDDAARRSAGLEVGDGFTDVDVDLDELLESEMAAGR